MNIITAWPVQDPDASSALQDSGGRTEVGVMYACLLTATVMNIGS